MVLPRSSARVERIPLGQFNDCSRRPVGDMRCFAQRSRYSRSLWLKPPFMLEQPFLAPQSAAVPAERAVRADDTMTWDHDANHVRAVRPTNCAARVLISELFR